MADPGLDNCYKDCFSRKGVSVGRPFGFLVLAFYYGFLTGVGVAGPPDYRPSGAATALSFYGFADGRRDYGRL